MPRQLLTVAPALHSFPFKTLSTHPRTELEPCVHWDARIIAHEYSPHP